MKKIPTAKEFCKIWEIELDKELAIEALIDFAKFHVQAALEEAAKKAELKDKKIAYDGVRSGGFYVVKEINKKSILNAYSKNRIK